MSATLFTCYHLPRMYGHRDVGHCELLPVIIMCRHCCHNGVITYFLQTDESTTHNFFWHG